MRSGFKSSSVCAYSLWGRYTCFFGVCLPNPAWTAVIEFEYVLIQMVPRLPFWERHLEALNLKFNKMTSLGQRVNLSMPSLRETRIQVACYSNGECFLNIILLIKFAGETVRSGANHRLMAIYSCFPCKNYSFNANLNRTVV